MTGNRHLSSIPKFGTKILEVRRCSMQSSGSGLRVAGLRFKLRMVFHSILHLILDWTEISRICTGCPAHLKREQSVNFLDQFLEFKSTGAYDMRCNGITCLRTQEFCAAEGSCVRDERDSKKLRNRFFARWMIGYAWLWSKKRDESNAPVKSLASQKSVRLLFSRGEITRIPLEQCILIYNFGWSYIRNDPSMLEGNKVSSPSILTKCSMAKSLWPGSSAELPKWKSYNSTLELWWSSTMAWSSIIEWLIHSWNAATFVWELQWGTATSSLGLSVEVRIKEFNSVSLTGWCHARLQIGTHGGSFKQCCYDAVLYLDDQNLVGESWWQDPSRNIILVSQNYHKVFDLNFDSELSVSSAWYSL